MSKYDGSDGGDTWEYHDDSAQSTKDVDFGACGFVTPPVVMVTLKGRGVDKYGCPPVYVLEPSKTKVEVLTVEDLAPGFLTRSRCDIYWVATGYKC